MNLKINCSIVLLIFLLSSMFFLSCSSTTVTFVAPVEVTTTYIRDYSYADGRVFDIGLDSVSLVDTANNVTFYSKELLPGDSIIKLFVYEQETDRSKQDSAIPAIINVKPQTPNAAAAEDFRPQYGVNQLEYGTEFTYEQNVTTGLYYVVFNTRRRDGRALAVYMEIKRNGSIITFGEINNVDTLNLKLIRIQDPLPSNATWGLMWRNVYDLRQRGVPMDRLNIKVFKGFPGREGDSTSLDYQEFNGDAQSYIYTLGLDQYDTNGSKVGDDSVDDRSEVWRPDLGLLIFPHRTPFNTDTVFVDKLGDTTQPLQDTIPSLYEYSSRTQRLEASRYYIQILTTSQN